jgi:hypothetical protein
MPRHPGAGWTDGPGWEEGGKDGRVGGPSERRAGRAGAGGHRSTFVSRPFEGLRGADPSRFPGRIHRSGRSSSSRAESFSISGKDSPLPLPDCVEGRIFLAPEPSPAGRARADQRRSRGSRAKARRAVTTNRVASGCAGFSSTFSSSGTMAEGTRSRACPPSRTQSSPACRQAG